MELEENAEKMLNTELEKVKAQLAAVEARNKTLEQGEYQYLSELFDSSNDLIQIFKPNGEIKFVNEAWRNKLGYRTDELKNLKFVDVLHEEHRKKTLQSLLKITAGSSIERFETVLTTKYGKNVYVTGKLTCLFQNDEVVEFRCIFFDITERFRAERAQALYYKIATITMEPMSLEDLYDKVYAELNEILNVSSFTIAHHNQRWWYFIFLLDKPSNHRFQQTGRRCGAPISKLHDRQRQTAYHLRRWNCEDCKSAKAKTQRPITENMAWGTHSTRGQARGSAFYQFL